MITLFVSYVQLESFSDNLRKEGTDVFIRFMENLEKGCCQPLFLFSVKTRLKE